MDLPGQSPKFQPLIALLLRSIGLFAILWQFRLLAADLADTPVYAATLVCAFAAACFLGCCGKREAPGKTRRGNGGYSFPFPLHPLWLNSFSALLILFLVPWAARGGIALPRLFVPGAAISLDSLLLNLDRNSFVSLLPFYWAAFSTYFAVRSRRFLRADIIASDVLLLVIYSIVRTSDLPAYRWPVLMIALFSGIIFLQILAFMFSLPPEYALQKREGILGGLTLFVLVVLGGVLLIRPSQEGAVDKGGGLLEPNMFHFDFSQVLRLESEISMNDDLAFIVRKDPEDEHIYLRRYVLSGYNPKQGFYRHETIDEAAQPQRLPDRRTVLEAEPVENSRLINQEYFLVNFDSSALIALKEPVEIVPFDSWDASSFSSAYAVQSRTSEPLPFELMDTMAGEFSDRGQFSPAGGRTLPEALELSPEEYAYYTEYGGNQRIAEYAREITRGSQSYQERIQILYETLKYGEYRYSLKPGIAPDGDQLEYFLFETKKGYCSYFAFALTLLLRSLGIPARIAAGFFIDPNLETFNYYPVRSDMAHAWVEVRFPGYGWVEFDPTTENLAEDEEFHFSSGVPQDLFERLMREILENRSRLNPKEGDDDTAPASVLGTLGRNVRSFLQRHWPYLGIALVCILFLSIRAGFFWLSKLAKKPRKKARFLWAHTIRRLRLAGFRRDALTRGEAEWAGDMEPSFPGIRELYRGTAAARYAPAYTPENWKTQEARYCLFSANYRKQVPLSRRVLGWLLPPLAMTLKNNRRHVAPLLAILLIPLWGDAVQAQDGQSGIMESTESTGLYNQAQDAQQAEFWERAIELYTRGIEQFPLEFRFPWALGRLYYSRNLYGLAWEAFRRAETLHPDDPDLLYQLSMTAGFLNETAVSAEYLERLLAISPDNTEAIGNLGWMYYKLHRLAEGERLLLDAQNRFGPSPDFAMTLGTIYFEMFLYEDAKKWYLEAIEGGESWGDQTFASVAHYNLSLLEARFYHYPESMERTNASLASRNRSSGWLARGELYLHRLDFPRTFADYQEAYGIDDSPLSKISMAQAFQIAGRLEEARLYAEDSLKVRDLSWMMNYGIDPDRYKRDLHQILWHTYSGLAETQALSPHSGLRDRFNSFVRERYYRFKSSVHRHLFRKYSLLSGRAYGTIAGGDLRLDALIQYYNALEDYPRRANVYLTMARDFEVPLIPQAATSYDAEAGALLKDRELLRRTIDGYDPIWERDMIAGSFTGLALLAKGASRRAERQDAAERLYALNRGALRQNGITLPVEMTFVFGPDDLWPPREAARLVKPLARMLGKAGIRETGVRAGAVTSGVSPARFTLTLEIQEWRPEGGWNIRCELRDAGRGVSVWRRSIPLPGRSARDLSAFARTLADTAFSVQ
jgi:transglutaminase-like putative cysteine protease/cytochrome c-type biogenesis protein CcmH/NrfG